MARSSQWLPLLLSEVRLPSSLAATQHDYAPLTRPPINRDTGVAAIESLMDRSGTFDYILLETTGLADPGNIAPLFWLDDGLGASIYLDGVVTLVDAKNIYSSLDEGDDVSGASGLSQRNLKGALGVGDGREDGGSGSGHEHGSPHLTTAHLQISHADVIVINKADLVTSEELEGVQARIGAINGLAKIHVTTKSQVPSLEGVLLDLHAYEGVEDVERFTQKGHSHLDPTISTMTLSLPALEENAIEKLDAWLRSVCWESKLSPEPPESTTSGGFEVHRIKGRICLTDGRLVMLQGVREIFELTDPVEAETTGVESKIVVIGRGLDARTWQESLDSHLPMT